MVKSLKNVYWGGGQGVPRHPGSIPVLRMGGGVSPPRVHENLRKIDSPSFWLLLGAPGSVWESLASILAARNRFLMDFPSQLGTPNQPKSFKNRCLDAFHLGLHFLIDFWWTFASNFDPLNLKNRAPAAARARSVKN